MLILLQLPALLQLVVQLRVSCSGRCQWGDAQDQQ